MKEIIIVGLLAIFNPQQATAQKTPSAKDGLKVGSSLPFHVVQFLAGSGHGGGCPSVMIANSNSRGVVIWSRSADAPVLQLARKLDQKYIDGEKTQGFLVVFDVTDAELKEKLNNTTFKHVAVGIARKSSKELFEKCALDSKVACVVSFIDQDEIKALWILQAGELSAEQSQAIVDGVSKQLRETPKKK